MGCDIHLFVEHREPATGKWVSVNTSKPFCESRNYNLFAILAGVRNGRGFAGVDTGDGFNPIALPRGVPADATFEYSATVDSWGVDGHSHSYLTLAELLAFDWTQETTHRGFVDAREFGYFYLTGKPDSWCGAVGGQGVEHISNEEMLTRIKGGERKFTWQDYHAMKPPVGIAAYYTRIEWREPYYASCAAFWSETMPRLLRVGKPEDVRVVFFFDN